jgi:hypothetical protein
LGLNAVRIHQDLRDEHGASVPSYHSVRRYVKKLRGRSPDPFRRLEVAPGREAQVDFGAGAAVLRVVLSHSRAGYSEAVDRQTTENFIRCIENAFHHFPAPVIRGEAHISDFFGGGDAALSKSLRCTQQRLPQIYCVSESCRLSLCGGGWRVRARGGRRGVYAEFTWSFCDSFYVCVELMRCLGADCAPCPSKVQQGAD